MQKLFIDHPELALDVNSRIPQWSISVNEMTNIPGLADALLKRIDYISKIDEEEYYQDVASEVNNLLQQEKSDIVYFVWLGKTGGSGPYIFNKIRSCLPTELQHRVQGLPSTHVDVLAHSRTTSNKNIHYYICDDSANSGRQLSGCLGAFDWYGRDYPKNKLSRLLSFAFIGPKNVTVHVKMMRITDQGLSLINESQNKAKNTHLSFVNTSPRMPTAADVLRSLGVDTDRINSEVRKAILCTHHGWPSAILGFFYHKIQDNLPPVLIPGGVKVNGVDPLLNQEIEKMYD